MGMPVIGNANKIGSTIALLDLQVPLASEPGSLNAPPKKPKIKPQLKKQGSPHTSELKHRNFRPQLQQWAIQHPHENPAG
jgi:hypothetical protein